MTTPDLCTFFGLPNNAGSPCNLLENTPITPNALFAAGYTGIQNSNLLTNGVGEIVQDEVTGLVTRSVIAQTIAWVIAFVLLLFVLLWVGTIPGQVAIPLIVFVILVGIVTIGWILWDVSTAVKNTSEKVKSAIAQNWTANRNTFLQDVVNAYVQAESQLIIPS
jgi:hypothetical protein